MAVFPIEIFTTDKAIISRNDRYKSSVLGRKFAGQPKGVYTGFIASVSPPSPIVTLAIDPTEGFSCIKLPSKQDPSGIDIIVNQGVTVDFTGQPSGDFPISIVAQASYSDDASIPTTASIITRSYGNRLANEVLIAVVDGPATALTILDRINHGVITGGSFQLSEVITGFDSGATATVIDAGDGYLIVAPISGSFNVGETITGSVSLASALLVIQTVASDIPFAFSDTNFGFMPSGSIESLQAITDIVNEVVATRIGLDLVTHQDLSARLAADQTAESMAGSLGLTFRVLRSNDYSVDAGTESIIVSGSFSEIDRDHKPKITLSGAGDETTIGAIASPNDATRNVCLIQDATSGYRPISDPTDRSIVFGRLEGPEDISIGGTWSFSNALKAVTGEGGNAVSTLQPGDTVKGIDGLYYAVDTITNNNSFTLLNAYTGLSAGPATITGRRWRLSFKKISSGVEVGASLPTPTTVRFFFPTFLNMANSNFDYSLALHTSAEREPLLAATESVPGAVRLADTGSLLGSVNIQNNGSLVTGGPFHTINFNAANASVTTTTTPGEVEVVVIGPVGTPGNIGTIGATGAPGPPGPGFSEINTFELSSKYAGGFPSTTPVPFSFTRNMGHNIRNLEGGIASWEDDGFFAIGLDVVQILSITGVGTTVGQIDGDIAADTQVTIFMSSSGD